MKKYQIKTIVFISLLTFTNMANATNGGKTKPPAESSERSTPTPEPAHTPSIWDWIKKHFYI